MTNLNTNTTPNTKQSENPFNKISNGQSGHQSPNSEGQDNEGIASTSGDNTMKASQNGAGNSQSEHEAEILAHEDRPEAANS